MNPANYIYVFFSRTGRGAAQYMFDFEVRGLNTSTLKVAPPPEPVSLDEALLLMQRDRS
jgi:hypothetical protein